MLTYKFERQVALPERSCISFRSCIRAVIMKYHRHGRLNNSDLFSHSSGGEKSKTKVLANSVFSESSLSSLYIAAFFLCLQMAFPPYTSVQGEME